MAEEDIIYGKNRHFFGGIEPSNMLAFSGEFVGTSINITATLPNDTVIDGQTLCTVAGAVIRRRSNDYPKDEFDGDLVATITSSTVFSDTGVVQNGTYYYSAFPFTAQGVYNRNKANRFVVNEPLPMEEFTATSIYDSGTKTAKVKITATLPEGAAGAKIRKSSVSYPLNENDGEEVQDISASGVYYDEDVSVGSTYYYSAFPYTATGAYNRNESNRISVTITAEPPKPARTYLYGYDIALNTADPEDRVTYPSDVDNYGFTPAKMNFGSSFNYGGWNFAPGEKFMPRPCMLNSNGTVAYYLNPDDYTKKSGGGASDVTNSSFDGNAMIEWPKIFTKRWEADGIYHFRCSDVQEDDSWECWSNYDRLNNQIDHFYTPIYFGSVSSVGTSKLRSLSGKPTAVSHDAETEIIYAKANGADWYTEVLADRLLIQDLLVMMAKSTDCQVAYGYGRSEAGGPRSEDTGTMDTRGMFWGSNNKDDGVKVFGMEHFWGDTNRRTAGWMLVNGTQKVKLTRGTHDGTSASDYNTTGSGYKDIASSTPSGSAKGYISHMKTETFGRFPITTAGSSSTFEADELFYSNSGTMYAICGGDFSDDLSCGPFYACLDRDPYESRSYIGAALSCKPVVT